MMFPTKKMRSAAPSRQEIRLRLRGVVKQKLESTFGGPSG